MTTGILILAAGRSARFGADKRLATLRHGRSVIDTLLANVRNSNLPFLVCLGDKDNDLAGKLGMDGVSCVQCKRSAEGMGRTLAEGAAHIPGWDGVLITLADMPWITPQTYSLVAAQLSASTISLPVFKGLPGHPVGFGRNFYGELQSLGGDIGAKQLLLKHSRYVHKLEVNDPAIHQDIDHPPDLDRYLCIETKEGPDRPGA